MTFAAPEGIIEEAEHARALSAAVQGGGGSGGGGNGKGTSGSSSAVVSPTTDASSPEDETDAEKRGRMRKALRRMSHTVVSDTFPVLRPFDPDPGHRLACSLRG